jgi:tetratricopeptide (TPR) repeat protein
MLPLSPRRRRLRWTIALVSLAAVAGVVVGILIYQHRRPSQYRPNESNADITSSLTRNLPAETPKPRFTDTTTVAGLRDFRTFAGNRTSQLPEDMGCGAAWGDFDNDGFEDLFLVSAGGPMDTPTNQFSGCALYKNLGNGSFRKVVGFPELRIHGMAAAWGDYDDDGFLDLVVSGYNNLLLLHNEGGSGKFTIDPHFENRPGFWSSAVWGDYNNDRKLDLYVCRYVDYVQNEADRAKISAQLGTAVPYTLNPSSYEPGRNLLFQNNGDGTFKEVAEKLGVVNPKGRSLGALWHDFDDDGWMDIYVANDISDCALYRNKGGEFEDLSYSAAVADYRSAMGLAMADWGRKGYDDLFISHWIGQQDALFHNLWSDLPPSNSAAGGKLKLFYMDIADNKGLGQISLSYIGWGTEFFDYDNDGWQDLAVINGSTLEMEGPAPKKLTPQDPFLFWNQRGEYFHNVAPLCPPLAEKHVGRGLAVADYDQDGTLDMLIVHLGEGVQLLHNELHTGNWIELRLRSKTRSGAVVGFADGTRVIAHTRDAAQRRTISSASYLSQNSRVVHFGLGSETVVDRLEIRWHAGETNFYDNLVANSLWEIKEGDPIPQLIKTPRLTDATTEPSAITKNTPVVSLPRPQLSKEQSIKFWKLQRAAMNALKVEKDIPKAIAQFRAAIELDPKHEDCRYYLGQCLAAQSDSQGGLDQFQQLIRINPQSHRAYQQWGTLRAMSATSDEQLVEADNCLERAHALNPEETGALLVLGEISLLRNQPSKAKERLSAACRSNPKASGGFFLRAYIAWKQADPEQAKSLLAETHRALGSDWQPKGTTAEGDVKKKQFAEGTPLSRFWLDWNANEDPAVAFASLDDYLRKSGAPAQEGMQRQATDCQMKLGGQ